VTVVTGRVAPWDVAIGDQVECFARDAFGPPGHLHRRRLALRWLHDQEERPAGGTIAPASLPPFGFTPATSASTRSA
jgi:hypothetical protein